MLKRLGWIGLVVALFANLASVTEAGSISSIIAFGDSLTDTGNVFLASGGTVPASPPYAAGRFSNAAIWIDWLSSSKGLGVLTPSLAGGTNYAVGGAESGSGFNPPFIPNLLSQVGGYLSSAGGAADPNAVYVIWSGSNDYINGETNPNVPASNIASAVSALASAGATRFIVPNIVPIGSTPRALATLTGLEQAQLNALVAQTNLLLKDALDALVLANQIQIHQPDIHGLFLDAQANPAAYGFTNTTSAALADGVLDGKGYLFWDDLHPTGAAHAMIASASFAVPEPSTGALSVLAVTCIGCYYRSRRSQAA